MMELNYSVLFAVTAGTFIIGLILHHRMQTGLERLYLWAFLCGIYVICGFGSAYTEVPHSYSVMYLVYVAAAGAGFAVVVNLFRDAGARTCRKIDWRLSRIDATYIAIIGFWLYFTSVVFPLVYPTMRLNLLWNPPLPDLQAAFGFGVAPDKAVIERLVGYVTLLCYPVYLWRLHAYLTRPVHLALAVFGPLYLIYCSDSYMGRGTILMGVGLYVMLLWRNCRRARKYLVVTLVVVAPLAVIASALYTRVRLTGSLSGSVSVSDEVWASVRLETGLPLNAAVVLDSGERVNVGDLALWAVTLPLPKVLTGNIVTFQPNFDMAEIITNIPQGARAFSVALPGVVGESVYFGGPWFYWISAVVTGGIFGFLCALCSKSNQLGGVTAYCVLLWPNIFIRAGLDAGLPMIINGLFPFLVVAVLVSSRGSTNRANGVMRSPNAKRLVPTHAALEE
ncbi:MAG: hypothetical protein ABSD43_17555 [Terracidiphilus sp.]|jgi:hypothetical protein